MWTYSSFASHAVLGAKGCRK